MPRLSYHPFARDMAVIVRQFAALTFATEFLRGMTYTYILFHGSLIFGSREIRKLRYIMEK